MIEKLKVPEPYVSLTVEKINEIIDHLNNYNPLDDYRLHDEIEDLKRQKDDDVEYVRPEPQVIAKETIHWKNKKPSGLTFEEAMKFLREGKKITRPIWSADKDYLSIEKPIVDEVGVWNLLENDWMVID